MPTANGVFYGLGCANNTHCLIGGGTNYSTYQTAICSYDTSFVKTTPTAMSTGKTAVGGACIGDYIVCCGGVSSTGNTDFYDNSNVKTTSSTPYNKLVKFNCGVSTPDYAVFFGGTTNESASGSFTDVKAYNINKVLTSFDLPITFCGSGFCNNGITSLFYGSHQLTYNKDLVLIENKDTWFNCNINLGYEFSSNGNMGVVFQHNSHNLRVFNI